MKRNLLTLLVAGLMLAACSKPDLVETPKADAIKTQAAGNITVAKDGTDVDVPVDATGYNTKFPDEAEPWNLSRKYTPGFVLSKASIMRYPGGTVTNYWDFDNDQLFTKKGIAPFPAGGWVTSNPNYIPEGVAFGVIDTSRQEVNTVSDLSNVVNQSGC